MSEASLSDIGKQLFRNESSSLMNDFYNIFNELITKYNPDKVAYKLSLEVNMSQIPYMHYSFGILNYICFQKGINTIERSNKWITAGKKSKIEKFDCFFSGRSFNNDERAATLVAWYGLKE